MFWRRHADSDSRRWTSGIVLKMANALAYALFLGIHVGFIYDNIYNPSKGKVTYITPAPWAFLVWPVLHLLFLGTIVYQFTNKGHQIIVDGISWRFIVLMLSNALFVYLWASREYLLALLVTSLMLWMASSITEIVREKQEPSKTSFRDWILLHVPFSLYHGWVSVLNMLSWFAAFGVDASIHHAGTGTKVCVFLALFHLHLSAAGHAFHSPPGDIAILTYLWAVFVQQKVWNSEFVHDVALVFAVLASIWVFAVTMVKIRKARRARRDEERVPLLGGDYVVVKRRAGTFLRVVW
ncbi:hypothetical protein BDY19DRAFT_894978 [Irpex rosettiformis]|uniref:Uncharacterized protein n=1 Tax=Irpex rosettiformis TaxID=378272 RepID=A0ACB8TWK2_9APHY|nr:hypothetical protein BDY19DRAFT_894978 [Irpex rosettiformis]